MIILYYRSGNALKDNTSVPYNFAYYETAFYSCADSDIKS